MDGKLHHTVYFLGQHDKNCVPGSPQRLLCPLLRDARNCESAHHHVFPVGKTHLMLCKIIIQHSLVLLKHVHIDTLDTLLHHTQGDSGQFEANDTQTTTQHIGEIKYS